MQRASLDLPIDLKLPITGQVHAWLRDAILTMRLQPKEALSEKELSLRIGVSRTPVREALIRLADEGLVDIFPQRGTFVSPIRLAEVMEARFLREALETAIAARLAEEPETASVRVLQGFLAQQAEAIVAGDAARFMVLDEAFHRAISDSVSMPRAWKVIQSVKGQLDRVRYLSLPSPDHLHILIEQHTDIVDAIRLGDPTLAGQAMKVHLEEVFKTIQVLLREKPELFS
ncbi:DNA-binding transcriptional regulator, GntR family [Faunimonas pinastri]|uniref:DNA-binding transcriptional regulator, GntR family n=1 Tax=Faunimonas pinastri TaxID=1855383 RepID=A0A1H9B359_9HYPH|nr:GntR family transcriptional regulator [Faunimonas pinastri]SEP83466.1 DNA-binding transcriptional regulator, GntR family [Faunimonas pinastri]